MKIHYNESDHTIEIKDSWKSHCLSMKILLGLNLVNAGLNLYDLRLSKIGPKEAIWLFIGTVSMVALFYYILKVSSVDAIPVQRIKSLRQTTFFGRKRHTLILDNGKRRNLYGLGTAKEMEAVSRLFQDVGIREQFTR